MVEKVKRHNGKFPASEFIATISSNDQYQDGSLTILGMDTEFLLKDDDKVLWPHELGLPQEREPNNNKVSTEARLGKGVLDIHGDGYATELCVPPVHCLEYMMENVGKAFYWMRNGGVAHKGTLKIDAPALYTVPKKVVDAAPQAVKRLGCAPSFNIYDDPGTPGSLKDGVRTTGCHLHMSHKLLKNEDIAKALVMWADVLVGSVWTYISPEDPDAESERRKAYGRAGEFRLKSYPAVPELTSDYTAGVEYRVLPGTVIRQPAYMTLMFNLYRSALRMARVYGMPYEGLTDMARTAINFSNRTLAKKVIDSIPFQPIAVDFFKSLREHPLRRIAPMTWYNISQNHSGRGHQHMAHARRTVPTHEIQGE